MNQIKTENPLFAIARTKHLYQYVSGDFEFLNDSEENKNTYTLGFCAGVEHTASIWKLEIEMLQQKVKELEKDKLDCPTLNLQKP